MEGEEEVAEPVEAVESVEEPAEEEAAPPSMTDLIFSDDEEKRPTTLKALDTALENDGGKAWSVAPERLGEMPIEAQQVVHNMERAFKAKTRGLADERKAFETERSSLAAEKMRVEEERAKLYQKMVPLASMFKPPEGEPPDPFTDEGRAYLVDKQLADRMKPFFEALQGISTEGETEIAEKLEAHRVATETAALKAHIDSDPEEWAQIRGMVKALVKGEDLHWKDAVEKALAWRGPKAEPVVDPDAERKAVRERARAIREGGGRPPAPPSSSMSYRAKR